MAEVLSSSPVAPAEISARVEESVPDSLAAEQQLAYAAVLDIGMKAGFGLLVATFALYVLGVVPPLVPLAELPVHWSMPANEYLAKVGAGTGWSWLALVHLGDFMNFVGIAFLSAVTIFCYLRILPTTFRSHDLLFGAILVGEVAVLLLGASGILAVGH